MSNDYILQLDNLKVALGGQLILENISFTVSPAEIVTVIGPNGAGKSTLMRTILGLEKPSKGVLRRAPELCIGYVPQKITFSNLIPLTVAKFLQIGGAEYSDIVIISEQLKLDRLLVKPIQSLSGGELQRVLLARALLLKPGLLILDEPVQGVDIAGQIEFYDLLANICTTLSAAMLLVSHDLHFVMRATNKVICVNKHICCQGAPQTVAQHPEFMNIFGQAFIDKLGVYQHYHNHNHKHEWDGQD